jgi:hypothetical protein
MGQNLETVRNLSIWGNLASPRPQIRYYAQWYLSYLHALGLRSLLRRFSCGSGSYDDAFTRHIEGANVDFFGLDLDSSAVGTRGFW